MFWDWRWMQWCRLISGRGVSAHYSYFSSHQQASKSQIPGQRASRAYIAWKARDQLLWRAWIDSIRGIACLPFFSSYPKLSFASPTLQKGRRGRLAQDFSHLLLTNWLKVHVSQNVHWWIQISNEFFAIRSQDTVFLVQIFRTHLWIERTKYCILFIVRQTGFQVQYFNKHILNIILNFSYLF